MKNLYNALKDHIQSRGNITFCARSRSLNFRYYKILLLLLFLTIFIVDAEASHYRYGNLTWRVVSGRTVEFTLTTSWASNAISTGWVNTGDGYRAKEIANNITSNVNGVGTRVQVFRHTYSSDGPFIASFSSCCRIFGLVNGSSAYWNLTSTVDFINGNQNSPVSSLPAIVNVPVGSSSATFQVPANDLDGDVLTYRLATASELRISSLPPGLSINHQTGAVTINTSLSNYKNGQLWVAGVIISDGKATTMVDFLISIKQSSTPPTFIYPPTPADGTVIQASPGQNINFDVSANEADAGDQVARLFVTGIPSGATFATASGNPATSTFNWTPTSSDFGSKVLNFIAEDNAGVQSSSSVTIQVSLKPRFDIPPTPATSSYIVVEPGQAINYTVQASDPDPDDVVQIISVEGKDMNGGKIPLYTGSNFSSLPSSAGNPTSGTFSWTPQTSDWGHRHVFFTAEDSYGDKTIHEVSQLVNTTPVFTSTPVTEINLGQTYTYNIQVADPDIAFGDAVQLYGLNLPPWLSFTDQGGGAGVLTGTPSLSDVGSYHIEIEAQDINHHQNIGGIPKQSFTLVVNPCTIELAVEHTNAFCDGGNGTIELTVTGANGVPSILWAGPGDFSASTEDITELSEGEYVATVTDEFGCTESVLVNVGYDTDNVKPTVVTQDITVQLDASGVASITATDINNGSSDNCAIAADGYSLDISSFSCADVGAHTVTLTVKDVNGNEATATAVVMVEDNVPPSITAPADIAVGNDAGQCLATVALGDATTSDNCSVASVSHDAPAEFPVGTTTVTWTAVDVNGNNASATQIITVTNEVPVISSIGAPLDPIKINNSFSVSASFTDNNLTTASWDWGDGTSSEGAIGTAEVTGSHSYSVPGLYTITCYVEDACGETASLVYQYVVAYDPDGGFVAGGGWIHSPAGAYVPDPAAEGKVNFGFKAKYKKGAIVPEGNTEFKFKVGSLDFKSTAYEWLVVAGHKVMYKGTGTINGSGSYGFQLSAVDGERKGSGEPDRIRMKIWDSNGAVVYDNQMGNADDAEAVLALGGGSIVIHEGGKKGSANSRLAVSDISEGVIAGFKAYPNPISEEGLWLEFPGREQKTTVQAYIHDLSGKVLVEKAFIIDKEGGKHLWNIDHENWAGGIYLLVIKGDRVSQQMRLMK